MADVDFDHHDPDFRANAPGIYARLRSECPVARSGNYGGFWTVSRYQDVFTAARDQDVFSSEGSVIIPAADPGFLPPLVSDSPALDRYRSMLSPFFTPAAVKALEPTIEAIVDVALEGFIARGSAELVEELCNPVPARTTMELLGMDPEDWRFFADPLHAVTSSKPGSDEFVEGMERLGLFEGKIAGEVDARLEQRRVPRHARSLEHPRDDMLSALLAAEPDGVRATREEVIGLVRMTIFGGMDTVTATMSNVLVRLGRDPELRTRLIREPELIRTALEEFLRLDPPIQGFARTVTKDCVLGGQQLAANDKVFLLWASANRDESVFDRPEEVVPERRPNRHMSFGIGLHRCLGSHLARAEMRVMLSRLLAAIPDYQLVPDEVVAPYTIGTANGWKSVGVRFTPSAAAAGSTN